MTEDEIKADIEHAKEFGDKISNFFDEITDIHDYSKILARALTLASCTANILYGEKEAKSTLIEFITETYDFINQEDEENG